MDYCIFNTKNKVRIRSIGLDLERVIIWYSHLMYGRTQSALTAQADGHSSGLSYEQQLNGSKVIDDADGRLELYQKALSLNEDGIVEIHVYRQMQRQSLPFLCGAPGSTNQTVYVGPQHGEGVVQGK